MSHLETEFPLLSCLTALLRWESQKRIVLCVVILILSMDGGKGSILLACSSKYMTINWTRRNFCQMVENEEEVVEI